MGQLSSSLLSFVVCCFGIWGMPQPLSTIWKGGALSHLSHLSNQAVGPTLHPPPNSGATGLSLLGFQAHPPPPPSLFLSPPSHFYYYKQIQSLPSLKFQFPPLSLSLSLLPIASSQTKYIIKRKTINFSFFFLGFQRNYERRFRSPQEQNFQYVIQIPSRPPVYPPAPPTRQRHLLRRRRCRPSAAQTSPP